MSFGLGFGGGDAGVGGAAGGLGGAAMETPGISPMQAGQKLFGSENPDSVQNRAKKALNTDKIGDVDATTRAAANQLGNPDTATAENVKGAMAGMKDLAMTGGKSLVGDAVGFMAGGAPAPGKLELALNGGVSSLTSFMAPATSPKEAMSLFRR